jgi:hypothetical protein
MKNNYKYLPVLFFLSMLGWGCNKEEALEPSADFTLSLTDNIGYVKEPFTLYLTNVVCDFITLYKGNTPDAIYNEDSTLVKGAQVDKQLDSISVTYNTAGVFQLTLLAATSGNWSEDYLTDVKTVQVTILDRRTDLSKFQIDKVDGKLSEDGTEIYFFDIKTANLTAKKPTFTTGSSDALVYIGTELQESGVSVVDFSPLSPGDAEGRPAEYKVVAPNGDFSTYTVKYILRDPYTGKQLTSLTLSSIGSTFIPDESAKTIEILYPEGTDLVTIPAKAEASVGATVTIGDMEIQEKELKVNLDANSSIQVTAEDGSVQDYAITKTAIEQITAFAFTHYEGTSGPVELIPAPAGVIDTLTKTIAVNILPGTDKTKLVATFSGLTNFTAKVGSNSLVSGMTIVNYTDPVTIDLYLDDRKLNAFTVTVNTVAKK